MQLLFYWIMNEHANSEECCPRFDPLLWNEQISEWQNKRFIKDSARTFFYMPINFGSVMKRLNDKAEKVGAQIPDWLCLSDHISKWKMDIYLAVDKAVPNAENILLSGKFFSKVYEGNFKETGNWMKDFDEQTKSRNLEIKKQYLWYTTCPKCAKKYGKNFVVIFGQI